MDGRGRGCVQNTKCVCTHFDGEDITRISAINEHMGEDSGWQEGERVVPGKGGVMEKEGVYP